MRIESKEAYGSSERNQKHEHEIATRGQRMILLLAFARMRTLQLFVVVPPSGRFAVPFSNKRTFTTQLQLTS